jgi:uncharacterized cupin superfamily protein
MEMAVIRDPAQVSARRGTVYPAKFAQGFEGRVKRALGDAGGLTQFGVNLTTIEPGAMSAHRHWHRTEDEFIYMLEGELTLITDAGEETLRPGMAAAFPAGEQNGHHLINRGSASATYLEIGTRSKDEDATYSDIDMRVEKRDGKFRFFTKSGEPY